MDDPYTLDEDRRKDAEIAALQTQVADLRAEIADIKRYYEGRLKGALPVSDGCGNPLVTH